MEAPLQLSENDLDYMNQKLGATKAAETLSLTRLKAWHAQHPL
jgi:hypothetical protein